MGVGVRVTAAAIYNLGTGVTMSLYTYVAVVFASFSLSVAVDICGKYPHPDPCLPGGEWDPVLNRSVLLTDLL